MTAAAVARTASGATPALLASPLTFTSMQTWSGGSVAGRWPDSRSAIFSRSTECTHANDSAIGRVLLLWIGPMKCQTRSRSVSARIFSSASCA